MLSGLVYPWLLLGKVMGIWSSGLQVQILGEHESILLPPPFKAEYR